MGQCVRRRATTKVHVGRSAAGPTMPAVANLALGAFGLGASTDRVPRRVVAVEQQVATRGPLQADGLDDAAGRPMAVTITALSSAVTSIATARRPTA